MKLTDAEIATMPPKTLKDPATVALYREHEFLDAYALHTDRRVRDNGYKAAVGASEENWETHGRLQFDFLRSVGLLPHHRLLEIGCGTGRLARQVVPFLSPGHYCGVDISCGAVMAALELAGIEGWIDHQPSFRYASQGPPSEQRFDFLWSFSVFIHLPEDRTVESMRLAAGAMHAGSRFYWSYVAEPENRRTGVKQFRKTLKVYAACARAAGLDFKPVPDWIARAGHRAGRWSGNQLVAVSQLAMPT